MSRVSRIWYLMAAVGLALLGYMVRKGLLHMAILGMILGFVAGFMIDASTRERSLGDNLAMALFIGGVMAYLDAYVGITAMTRESLGQGFILAMVALAIVTFLGSLMDEVRTGHTVRISYMPTTAMVLALLLLFQAVSVNDVSYTRTSHFGGTRTTGVDTATWSNGTINAVTTYTATPVINGTKASTMATDMASPTLVAFGLAIYRVSNTTWVRHAGNLTIDFAMSVNTSVTAVKLLVYKNGGKIHEVVGHVQFNASSLTGHAVFTLSSVDVYYSNIGDFVMFYVDVDDVATSSITVSVNAAMHGERVLDRTMAYMALALEGIAALLAMPEDVTHIKRRIRRRR